MTRGKLICALGLFGLCLYGSLAVLFGHIPGSNSSLPLFAQMGDLVASGVETKGRLMISLGIFLFGGFLAILCLAFGDGELISIELGRDDSDSWGDSDCGAD